MYNGIMKELDRMCDSQNCFNDRLFEELQIFGKENVAKRVLQETTKKFENKIMLLNCKNKTAEQIYYDLKAYVLETELQFEDCFGCRVCLDENGIRGLIHHVLESTGNEKGLFLKQEVARRLLIEIPPVNLISFLKFKNVQELMEFEDIYSIFCAIRVTESKEWTDRLFELYKSLKFSDFEERHINVKIFDAKRYYFLIPALLVKQTIWEDKMLGTMFGIPIPSIEKCPVPNSRILSRAYHYYCELLFHSKFISYIGKSSKSFGARMSNLIKGKYKEYNFFEPHCLSECLYWSFTYEQLGKYVKDVPLLNIWMDSFFTGGFVKSSHREDTLISFNFLDALTNVSKSKEFAGNTRILAMAIKGRAFELLCGSKGKAEKLILENLDKGYIDIFDTM